MDGLKKALIVIFVIAGFLALPWLLLGFGLLMLPNPPKPAIKYGEFPFRLVYEINGKRKVIEDIYVCSYVGVGINEADGKYRKWKGRYKSGKIHLILLKINSEKEVEFSMSNPEYLMGDKDPDNLATFEPSALFVRTVNDNRTFISPITSSELYERYHVKIRELTYAIPIINRFK